MVTGIPPAVTLTGIPHAGIPTLMETAHGETITVIQLVATQIHTEIVPFVTQMEILPEAVLILMGIALTETKKGIQYGAILTTTAIQLAVKNETL
jgi:hypothetical protein